MFTFPIVVISLLVGLAIFWLTFYILDFVFECVD